MKTKKVAGIEIISPGSAPDVDSDFNTVIRENVLEYVTETYGKDNVSNIITFGTLAAKGAFKAMCTIYDIPFSLANKIANLVPAPLEGVECTLDDIFNPDSDRYDEGADFREATSSSEWTKIVEGARKIEGRNKSTGVHACFSPDTLITTSQGYRRIDEIQKGDYVLTHTNSYKEVVETMINDEGTLFSIAGANSLPTEVTGDHPVYVRSIERAKDKTRKLSAPIWKRVEDLVIGEDLIGIPVNTDSKIPTNSLDLPYEDPDFWWIVGRFVGDGWCEDFTSVRNRKKKNGELYKYIRQEKNIVISVGYNDTTHDQLIQKLNKLFNYRISPSRTTNKIYITQNNDLFTYLKTFGQYAQNKVVPNDVISLPNNLLKKFIEGYLSADGWFDNKTQSYSFNTVSKSLALSMISAINKVYRTHCSVTVEKRSKMTIENREVKCHDRYTIRFKEGVVNKQQSFYKDDYIWAKLKKVEKLDKKIRTYNFSVIDDNSYVANGFVAHNCGIIISSEPLDTVIPLQVRQNDGRVITQWTYKECESLGLIKMDFLGLDTVDLIQHSVEYIMRNGKNPPNMLTIIHGEMNDPKVYKLFQKGYTTGIFQFGSDMVRNLLLTMSPTEFNDLAACTAVARPGPMGMKSHTRYADRKNGREEIDYIHPEFKNTIMEEILGDTYGLVVYQEQVIKIANLIAGMTLQEGDDLRKAMGKKIKEKMDQMRPKFFSGAIKNGYSEEAVKTLWDTIAEFAKYGFNKSHSVAYAMNAYQAAYLKAHYPIEFMAALIAQNVNDRDKTLAFLREAKRMGINMGTVDINLSDVKVAPDYSKKSGHEILFGISGVKEISEHMASIIVKERNENGPYSSVQDLINRCTPLGVTNRKIFENLALAGAFDHIEPNRHAVVKSVLDLMGNAKKKSVMGDSLFDMFEITEEAPAEDIEDYSFVEKLKHEANMVGLYLSAHPLDHIEKGVGGSTTIEKLFKSTRKTEGTILASVVGLTKKNSRRGKSITLDLDDGTGFMSARLSPDVINALDKFEAQESVKKLYEQGENEINRETRLKALNPNHVSMAPIEKNSVYLIKVLFQPGRGDNPYGARIELIKPISFTHKGTLPIRIRFKINNENKAKMSKLYKALPMALNKKIPGDVPIYICAYKDLDMSSVNKRDYPYRQAIIDMDNDKSAGINRKNVKKSVNNKNIFGQKKNDFENVKSGIKKAKFRSWPPEIDKSAVISEDDNEIKADINDVIESLEYIDSGFTTEKSQSVAQLIEKYVGYESYDFGIFNPSVLDD